MSDGQNQKSDRVNNDWACRCVALTTVGVQCSRWVRVLLQVTFAWDPVRGVGIAGPQAPMCRQHGYFAMGLKRDQRVPVVGGWFGRIFNQDEKVWTVLNSVFDGPASHDYAPAWWAHREDSRFGECRSPAAFGSEARHAV